MLARRRKFVSLHQTTSCGTGLEVTDEKRLFLIKVHLYEGVELLGVGFVDERGLEILCSILSLGAAK